MLPAGADYRYTPQIEIDESCGAPVAATRVCRAWKLDADGRERPFGPAAIRPTPQPCNPSSQAQSPFAQSCQ